jgi:hypothetical protein
MGLRGVTICLIHSTLAGFQLELLLGKKIDGRPKIDRTLNKRLCPENKVLHLMFYYELRLY